MVRLLRWKAGARGCRCHGQYSDCSCAVEKFHRHFPDHFKEMICAYLEGGPSKFELDLKCKNHPESESQGLAYGSAEESFLVIYAVLTTCLKDFHDEDKLADKPKDNIPANQYRADRAALFDFLWSLEKITRTTDEIPAEDEFTKASRQFISDRKIPVWYLFAANAYLICRRLDESIEYGLQTLQSVAKIVAATIHEEAKFRGVADAMGRDQKPDDFLDLVACDLRDWTLEDPSSEYEDDLPDEKTISRRAAFLSINPIICGLLLLRIRIILHDESVGVANEWSTIQYAGHLYSAMQEEELLVRASVPNDPAAVNHKWTDMDFVIKLYDDIRFFYGARPRNPEEYFKQFSLILGYSATNFASHRRKFRAQRSKEPKTLDRLAPVSLMFRDCVVGTNARMNFDLADIQKVMAKVRSCGNSDEIAWPDNVPSKFADKNHNLEKFSRRRADKEHGYTPVQLLTELRAALHSERIELAFDFLRFHRFCRTLLLNITRELKPELEEAGATGMYELCELHLPITVGYILITIADVGHLPGLDRAKTWPKNSLIAMRKAARVVQEEIAKAGDLEVMALR